MESLRAWARHTWCTSHSDSLAADPLGGVGGVVSLTTVALFVNRLFVRRVAHRYDALEIERISSERRRGLSIAVGKKVHTFNFPNLEHRYVPQSSCEPS